MDNSGGVDEWELWHFIQKGKVGGVEDLLTFEEMQSEFRLVDVDQSGTIEWEEFTDLMMGRVAGTDKLAAAMRTGYTVAKVKSRQFKRRGAIHSGNNADVCLLPDFDERPMDPSLLPVLRRVLAEQKHLDDDVAVVLRVLAPDGARVDLSCAGEQSMFAEGEEDAIFGDLFGSGSYWSGWAAFHLREPGDGVLLGLSPRVEFMQLLKERPRLSSPDPA